MAVWPGATHWAAGLGEGIGQGLDALAKHKLDQVLERQGRKREADELEESAGFTPQYARFVASQPKEHQYKYLLGAGPEAYKQNRQPPTQEQVQQNRTQEAQALAVSPQEQQAIGLQDLMQSLNPRGGAQQGNPSQQQLAQMGGGQNYLQSLLGGLGQQPGQLGTQGSPQAQGMQPQQPMAPQQAQMGQQAQPVQSRPGTIYGAIPKAAGAKRNFEEEMINKEQRKASHAYEKEVKADYKIYRENDAKLKLLGELANTGKLNSPEWATFVNGITIPHVGRIGLPKSALTNESQLFETTATDLALKSAKSVFGSRLTGGEVNLLQSTKPSLGNSNEVRKSVINNLKILNDASKIKYDALAEIKAVNGGEYPHDVDELVERVAGPRLDALYEDFRSNFSKNKKVEERPSASSPEAFWSPGEPRKFKKGGKIYASNGKEYVEVS